ncbi:MAG: FKBP-type peptidyl-prolyl cis-trans isomerase [Bacteroidales bacterium]|nr:FKBP-type peptidyl-prolyl cis-trans isomerase [Bacteroidales bacterium]MBQ5540168.1 FKBP-type peptidyl-prolyl cis-trans isomerase [Bacteroidales bacterium]MBR4676803.1 FKBP-type peptidyl-prolyl cis-trans isomerase [Bacteroidales bacterium]MEE3447793.1 FKBP-type peptidyl-prolyl cis-trans isomerase [Bacteroidales bacterium]
MKKSWFIFTVLTSLIFFACSKEKDGRQAEEEALESFFKPYGDTCFVKYDGIYLYLTTEGEEEYQDGDSLILNYSGRTLENPVTFAPKASVSTIYPGEDFIEGWKIALKHIKKNSEGILVVPYKKGYGKNRTGVIEPFSTLVYNFSAQ